MKPVNTFLIITVSALFFGACHRAETPARHVTTRLLMGTLVTITTWNVPDDLEEEAVVTAFDEIARIEQLMNSHTETAVLASIVPETWSPLSKEFFFLLQEALKLQRLTDGAFDPALLPILKLWNFSGKEENLPTAPPDSKQIAAWLLKHPKQQAFMLRSDGRENWWIRVKDSVGLDLGGIAKGYAIDRAIAILRNAGIQNAIVNAGGDLRVIGGRGAAPWRIGIQHPRDSSRVIALCELLGDRAMVTSGDYERFFMHQTKRYHHIIDPATGMPASSGLTSVSIQADHAMVADALSTAVFVMGREKGVALIESLPNIEGLWTTSDGHHGKTAGFVGEWTD